MLRLLFEKKGNAVWISHLDLMRLFQRAFKRAGFSLTHTKGFNPRPSVSIALPLSVGVESSCELLDFELEEDFYTCEEIQEKLNSVLIDGVRVLQVYSDGNKLKNLALLKCNLVLEYDGGVPDGAAGEIQKLLSREEVIVLKKSKNGIQDQNIIPMIKSWAVVCDDPNILNIQVIVCCQNPSLNPMQIISAVEMYLPHLKPDFSFCCREEIFDDKSNVFR